MAATLPPAGAAGQLAIAALPEPRAHAEAAGLRYVTDREPGIGRVRAGDHAFRYVDAAGKPVTDRAQLARIRALAIPPAWRDVWICRDARGHLQATGRDARGRKQYRYHAKWRAVRDATKYDRMLRLGELLPRVRARVRRDLRLRGMPREKVLASIVRLMEATLARVGNDEYARANGSFGLTTIRNRHARVRGDRVKLQFRGKAGKLHAVELEDPRVARVVRRCQEMPGQELFCYQDDEGLVRDVKSDDVNAYLREATGEDFTAKDLRTWAGSRLALAALAREEPAATERGRKRQVARAMARVAERLHNTPAVCRKCYVHPAVLECYLDGEVVQLPAAGRRGGLAPDERALLSLLRARAAA